MKIDIVIPLYNEEKVLNKSISTLVDFLQNSSFPYGYIITLADNGSTDNSWKICNELSRNYKHVRCIKIDEKGKGVAIRTAWKKSDSDIVTFMDVDLASDINSFRDLVEPIVSGKSDMVIGNRLGMKSKVISNKKMRKFASKIYNFAVQFILHSTLPDHQCGFKAMKKDKFELVFPFLTENGWFFDTELIVMSLKNHLRIQPIDIIWRDGDESKVSLFSDSIKMFIDIILLRIRIASIVFTR
jgi:glycosyltransferase involved in cell wall biosynthesis